VTTTSFASLPLSPALLRNLDSLGYLQMTAIQAASLPEILAGRDLIAQAKTGSGKTAAFGLGILHTLVAENFALQALVLCPTRELADQVANELRRLARQSDNVKVVTLCGGTPIAPQIASLEGGAHIAVGTPGRIRDHLGRASIDLSQLKTLVLDEADRMTDMGFFDEIANIVSACPANRQTLLFSATYPDDIRHATAEFLREPAEIKVEALHDGSRIEQRFYEVPHAERNAAVVKLLQHFCPASALIFCNTKIHCRELVAEINRSGMDALALHGDLEQRDRDEILIQFANRSCPILVATDVAARGLDIQSLAMVISADISRDQEVHVHRIGRTGRVDESGLALSLCAPEERKWVKLVEDYQGQPASWYPLAELETKSQGGPKAQMRTLLIIGGKRDKLRPGDLLGALTGEVGLTKEQVGKINVFDTITYVALDRQVATQAMTRLAASNIKGKRFKMKFLSRG
jgi:ATP-independent RNA helicase DbpA